MNKLSFQIIISPVANIVSFNFQMESDYYTVLASNNSNNVDILSQSLNIAFIGGGEYGSGPQDDLGEDQENNGWVDNKFQSHSYDIINE